MDTSATALMHGMGEPNVMPGFESVPEDLKKLSQWVVWKIKGEKGKVPYQPNGNPASTSDPATWSPFAAVVAALANGGFDGIGFVFTDADPYCGIDLDKCIDPATGEIKPWAKAIVDKMGSYTEISPSGRGLHIIGRAKPKEGRRKGGIEIYPHSRYFTVTGQHLAGTPKTIEDADEAVAELIESLSSKGGPSKEGSSKEAPKVGISDIEWDADLKSIDKPLQVLLDTDIGFHRTWAHQRDDLADQSLSTYDMSLVSQAALHHGWEPTALYLLLLRHRQHYKPEDAKGLRRDYIGDVPPIVENVREALLALSR